MIKKILLLFLCINVFSSIPGSAKEPKRINPDPGASRDVLKMYFEHMVTNPHNAKFPIPSQWTDKHIFLNVLRQYKYCLEEGEGTLSTDCVIHMLCDGAFRHVLKRDKDKPINEGKEGTVEEELTIYCDRYGKAMSEATPRDSDPHCIYNIGKIGAWQERVRYELKSDKTGFVRTGGYLPWRTNNPGNIREGEHACAKIYSRQKDSKKRCGYAGGYEKLGEIADGCVFSVYATEEQGWEDLRNLLKNGGARKNKTFIYYKNLGIDAAINMYAPQSDDNNPKRYACNIKRDLYEYAEKNKKNRKINKNNSVTKYCVEPNFSTGYTGEYDNIKIGKLDDEELEFVIKKIADLEGWPQQEKTPARGETECFDANGDIVDCPSDMK